MSLAQRIHEWIRREGPIPFDRFVEAALYDPEEGFFATGGGAGRAGGHFVTSPEVGALFGALVARALDREWEALGRPDPFVVVEAGAGRGQLCRDVLRAGPACLPALRYVMVERSAALRALQHEHLQVEPPDEALGPAALTGEDDTPEPVPGVGPIVTAVEDMPSGGFRGVVLANELLDNLPFRVVERTADGWQEVRVAGDGDGFTEITVPLPPDLEEPAARFLGDAPPGSRLPLQLAVTDWLDECARTVSRGAVVLFDYAGEAAELAQRGGWLRTFRHHERGGPPLEAPGTQDVTADVVLEALRWGARHAGFDVEAEAIQADWLRDLGLDELVDAARVTWDERAAVGDLEALAARSRVSEAAALTDPSGLGAHRVVVLRRR